jgi:hypothetical protein
VRWEQLFADLEAQLEAAERADLDGEVAERTRADLARIALLDRLRASTGARLPISVVGLGSLSATVHRVGVDWALLAGPGAAVTLVAGDAIATIASLGRDVQPLPDEVARGLDLRFVLRGLARDRTPVQLTMRDGAAMTGTIDRVGADHLDLAEHPLDEPRRASAVLGTRAVALGLLAAARMS